jgi:hypothetical protein
VKLAAADFLIWVIIFVVISAVQGWKKLQGDSEDEEPATPPPPPQPRPKVNRPPRPVAAPPVVPHATPAPAPSKTWHMDPVELEKLRRKFEPVPVVQTVAPAPPPATPAVPAPAAHIARQVKSVPRTRSSWAARLRDHATARQSIVVAEILGPPKGLAS